MPASTSNFTFDGQQILLRALKYILEGIVTAFAAYFIPGKKPDGFETLMIGLVAAATFAVLDLFAPAVGASVRTGAGFGIGANLVGFPGGNAPNVNAWF
jgi:ABC-type Co2+ transport system permease subunit